MIHREAWYIEAEVFEREMRLLMEQARRGLVTPEEFMQKMLRLYPTPEGMNDESPTSLLSVDQDGDLMMSTAWVQMHQDWVSEAETLMRRLRGDLKSNLEARNYPKFQVDALKANLGILSGARRRVGMSCMSYFPGLFPRLTADVEQITTERDFNEKMRETLQSARQLVSELETGEVPQ